MPEISAEIRSLTKKCSCFLSLTTRTPSSPGGETTANKTFPAWALAARIVFAISPNSASCERVFALLKNLFGEEQSLSLADYVQASLMLNYNDRSVG